MVAGKNGKRPMVKYLFNSLLIFFFLSSISLASNIDTELKNEFGADLTHVPFFLRYSFGQHYNEDWKDSTYSERKSFLIRYEDNLKKQKAQDIQDAKIQAVKDKAYKMEQDKKRRKLAARLKAEEVEQEAEEKEARERQRSMDQAVEGQKRDLAQMEDQFQQQQQAQQLNR